MGEKGERVGKVERWQEGKKKRVGWEGRKERVEREEGREDGRKDGERVGGKRRW